MEPAVLHRKDPGNAADYGLIPTVGVEEVGGGIVLDPEDVGRVLLEALLEQSRGVILVDELGIAGGESTGET